MSIQVEDLRRLHGKVFRLFNYEFDERNYGIMEHWQSHAQSVNENQEFTDDCDGFAFTCCELLIEQGVPRNDVLFIVCETETGEGHAVCGCTLGEHTYILENRYNRIYDWQHEPVADYQWKFYMRFDKPGQWYQITND